jgi:hypothetical protein
MDLLPCVVKTLDAVVPIPHNGSMKTSESIGERMNRDEYLTTGKAAARLHVSTKTLSRWRLENRLVGKVRIIRTLGGPKGVAHFRYLAADINVLAAELAAPVEEAS